MNGNVPFHHGNAYTVETPVYVGPLDLLLQLIERAELDITKLALAQVTDQFLAHLQPLDEVSPAEVSAFLVIAARLVQIKSEVLLPRPASLPGAEEDSGESLVRQLLAYKQLKDVANLLANREEQGLHTYLRLAAVPKGLAQPDLNGLGLDDLVAAAQSAFAQAAQAERNTPLDVVVPGPTITIREKINLIGSLLRKQERVTFRALFKEIRSRLEVVVTFLAVLELIKRHLITVHQEGLFGEIEVETAESWVEGIDFDLEFGE
jgi:segregation and condensation protein A